ncbi:MAG: hypothetical protein AB7G40_16735 [Hyphomonadaceae bacterium]
MEVHTPEPMEAKPSGHRFWDIVVSLTALIISGASMFTAYHTSHTMEKLVQANSWPFVQLDSGNVDNDSSEPALIFVVANAGTGPARVHSLVYQFDGQPVEGGFTWDRIAQACCAEARAAMIAGADGDMLTGYGVITTSSEGASVLAPGEERIALNWPHTALNHRLWTEMDQARRRGRITMRACFCSVFDECWVTETNLFPPQPVDACEPGATARQVH